LLKRKFCTFVACIEREHAENSIKALRVANRALELSGSYGVHPSISVSFRESQKFHKRVREVIKENK